MKAVHCLWLPESVCEGKLFVWLENPARLETRKKIPKIKHPFTAPVKTVRTLLEHIFEAKWREFQDHVKKRNVKPSLPTKKIPEISKKLAKFYNRTQKGEYKQHQWRVEGISMDKAYARRFLFNILSREMDGIILGDDVLFWNACLKFSFELAIRQRFLPGFVSKDDEYYGIWNPSYNNPKDGKRFLGLVNSMPGVCKSFSDKLVSKNIVGNFISTMVDNICRRGLVSCTRKIFKLNQDVPIERWITSLVHEPHIEDKEGMEELKNKWKTWIEKIRVKHEQPFRTCFKLDYSENSDLWWLSFFIQAVDDPTILIPLRDVWRKQKDELTVDGRVFHSPHESVLTDLGIAARFFPPLQKSLKRSTPERCRVGKTDVYSFLKETSVLMEELGIGVLLPAELKERKGLNVKIKMKQGSTKIDGTGMMGMDSVFGFNWEVAIGDQVINEKELNRLAKLKIPFVNLRGKWVEFDKEELKKTLHYLKSKDQLTLTEVLQMNAGGNPGLDVADIEYNKDMEHLFNAKFKTISESETFQGRLRGYQINGLSWLAFLSRCGFGGCLADDMGLGKTIQLIALILHEKEHNNLGPCLIVCPTSIVGNWKREFEKFSPSLNIMVHHGDRLKGKKFTKIAKKQDAIITTYGLCRLDEAHLKSIKWDMIVLDEAQNIKNPYAKQTRSIKNLDAKQRIALTGTPVENRLSELWSIMDFLNPGFLGKWKEFKKTFASPIERYDDKEKLKVLKKLIQPFVLRRMKTNKKIIDDLPEKTSNKVYCNLTKEQASLYKAIVESSMYNINESEGIKRKGIILATLVKLKQVCNHPSNFSKDKKGFENRSGKLNRLKEMIEEVVENDEKCLVFTQFKEMGQILKEYLQEQFNTEVLFLHGGVTRKKREEYIKRFQKEEPHIFVLSIKAGGTGLNLTAANHVFHFDRWWNPAVEKQATDRTFRIGQNKNVFVYKLICEGTIEEKIDDMIERKKKLAESVVGKGKVTELSTNELKDLFSLREEHIGD